MKYEVTARFFDMNDETKHVYNVGDVFPREGFEVDEERLKNLSSKKNKLKKPLIKIINDKVPKNKEPKQENDHVDNQKENETKENVKDLKGPVENVDKAAK